MPPRPGRTSQYPFLSCVDPRLTCPSGQRGAGSTAALPPDCCACAKTEIKTKPSAASSDATLTTNLLLPHRQPGSVGQDHFGGLLRPPGIGSVFGGSRCFDGDPVPDFDRVSLPATPHESVWRPHFDLEISDPAAF